MAELEQRLESEHPSGPPGEAWHPSAADEVIQPVDDGDEPNAGDGVEGSRLDGGAIGAGGGRARAAARTTSAWAPAAVSVSIT